jgi:signal peptidase I
MSAPQSSLKILAQSARTLVYALGVAILFRIILFQPFSIPSPSMQPTLLPGDFIIISKWDYGYSRFSLAPFDRLAGDGQINSTAPKRGDIIVFRGLAEEGKGEVDLVKRLIGLPGDRIQMRNGKLYINERAVAREPLGRRSLVNELGEVDEFETYRETLDTGVSYLTFDRRKDWIFDDTPTFTVPAGRYFFMGDDRDVSQDSRTEFVGYVPQDRLIGRVRLVLASVAPTGASPMARWRGERFWRSVS